MRYLGPTDPELRRAWQQARRQVVRAHHPDRGGEPDRLHTELEAIDNLFAGVGHTTGHHSRRASLVRRASRITSRTVRAARRQIPPGWPGSRRYFDL